MKKRTKIILAIIVLLIVLVPLPPIMYKDGGTKDFKALFYRVVVWNKLTDDEEGIYHKTRIYFHPEKDLSIDELWQRERSGQQ